MSSIDELSYVIKDMRFEIAALYTEMSIVCIFLLIYVLIRIYRGIVNIPNKRYLRYIIYSMLGVISIDTYWKWVEEDFIILHSINYAYFINSLYFICIDIMIYYIFYYFQISHDDKESFDLKWKTSVAIIFVLHMLANLFNIYSDWFFYITPDYKYHHGTFYYCEYVIPYTFLLICLIQTIFNVSKNRSIEVEYGKSASLVIFSILSMISGYLGIINKDLPFYTIGISITLFIYYIRIVEFYVKIDPITGIPNKMCFTAELKNRMIDTKINFTPLYCLFISIDDLEYIKNIGTEVEINVVGKRLVKAINNVNNIRKNNNIFAAKYSYNKLAILLTAGKASQIGDIIFNIKREIDELTTKEGDDIFFNISYGCARYRESLTIKEFIDKVEESLMHNIEKRNRKNLKYKEGV